MRILAISLAIFFAFSTQGYAQSLDAAKKFAREYEDLLRGKAANKPWKFTTNLKVASAEYKEKSGTVSSNFKSAYQEFSLDAFNIDEAETEKKLSFSLGSALRDTETWYVDGEKYQDNDLDFYRLNLSARLGKILHSERYKNLTVTPFIGYGFRYIKFTRKDFVILDVINIREVVTEEYFIHQIFPGIDVNYAINDRWVVSGLLSLGYIFYNQANNSALGVIQGDPGGITSNINADLGYSLTSDSKLTFGFFIDNQLLKGGETTDVIWPENKLHLFGATVSYKKKF